MKLKEKLRAHQYKIIIGAPIIFLLLINTSGMLAAGNTFFFTPEKTLFPIIGENVRIRLEISTKAPVNAVAGTIHFPTDMLSVESLARDTSIIDLWSEEPMFSNTEGLLHLSGGIVDPAAHGDRGTVITVTFRAKSAGKATLTLENGELLAANGEGTNIFSASTPLTLVVREQGRPSPDVNGDGTLSLGDLNTLYIKTFYPYDPAYDLNGDGKVSWADVRFLLSLM